MGVDWLTCHNCGNTFPDCGDFVHCECGNRWCDKECAAEDKFEVKSCKLGFRFDDPEEGQCKIYDKKGYCSDGCDDYQLRSCKYCRNEDFEDSELLELAIEMLNLTRLDLIGMLRDTKKSD